VLLLLKPLHQPIFVIFFEVRSLKLFALADFELLSS
jgi:hypothetical protein